MIFLRRTTVEIGFELVVLQQYSYNRVFLDQSINRARRGHTTSRSSSPSLVLSSSRWYARG